MDCCCSCQGKCDYDSGACMCPPGWSGGACERRECPGGSNPCSGHGQCLNMKQLALSSSVCCFLKLYFLYTCVYCSYASFFLFLPLLKLSFKLSNC
jgi:hypothetical protein